MKSAGKSQLLKLLATLFVLTLIAVACGSDDATGTATSECGTDVGVEKGDSGAVNDLTANIANQFDLWEVAPFGACQNLICCTPAGLRSLDSGVFFNRKRNGIFQ